MVDVAPCPKCKYWKPSGRHVSISKAREGNDYLISCAVCDFLIDGLINPRAAVRAWNGRPR